eukprot:2935418-Pleurochrysis_carterae.AAC.1
MTLVPSRARRGFGLHTAGRIRDVARWVRRLNGPRSEGGSGSVEFNLAAQFTSFVFTEYCANCNECESQVAGCFVHCELHVELGPHAIVHLSHSVRKFVGNETVGKPVARRQRSIHFVKLLMEFVEGSQSGL